MEHKIQKRENNENKRGRYVLRTNTRPIVGQQYFQPVVGVSTHITKTDYNSEEQRVSNIALFYLSDIN